MLGQASPTPPSRPPFPLGQRFSDFSQIGFNAERRGDPRARGKVDWRQDAHHSCPQACHGESAYDEAPFEGGEGFGGGGQGIGPETDYSAPHNRSAL